MKNTLALVIVALALALAFIAGCGKNPEAAVPAKPQAKASANPSQISFPADSPQLARIKVAAVDTAQVPTVEVTAPGKVELNANHVSHVALPLSGRIAGVLVRLGDQVKSGQPLLLLESPDVDAAMSTYLSSQAGVNTAKSGVLKTQADYDRVKDLFENKAVAQKEVVNAESALAQSKAALEQAQAAREQAERRVAILGLNKGEYGQKVAVKAPMSGKILELNVASGEYRNDTNAPLMTIADLSTVWVASDVPETQIRFIEVGEPLEIVLSAYPGQTFRARVTRIADTVDPQTRTIKVRAEMDNRAGRFRPEMFGSIRHVESTTLLPVVPVEAVMQSDGQNIVYREVSKGVFEPVAVKLGNRETGRIGVEQGLKKGDRIIVDGVMLLKSY